MFSESDGPVPLEKIAREAGVGIGTLYRHFPSRDSLLEAIYQRELEDLCAKAPDLAASLPADTALRIWMDGDADFVATKRGMAGALRGLLASGTITAGRTRAQLSGAISIFLDRGAKTGTLREDVEAADVTAALAGALMATDGTDEHGRSQAGRLLDLLIDGLRHTGPQS